MKNIGKLIIFVITFLALASNSYAQSPREQLNQMVELLQKTPGDNALREKIIRLAAEAIPEEAERRMARGEAAFERAKDQTDYANAVREFQAAATAAPWLAISYFNLGVTEEKADHPKEAMENFRWYLLAAPNANDAADVRKRLFKLEYAAEQNSRQAAIRAQEQRVSEVWRYTHALSDGVPRLQILHVRQAPDGKWNLLHDFYIDNKQVLKEAPYGARDLSFVDGELRFKIVEETMTGGVCGTYDVRGTVSADGNTLNLAYTLMPFASERPNEDCPLKSSYGSFVRTFKR
ncbi:MAG: hypothetical protein HYV23_01010 [Deltaproteobacteria bacterium]|nr:hypothetical protein [Deltaproteobacteria bacterium]